MKKFIGMSDADKIAEMKKIFGTAYNKPVPMAVEEYRAALADPDFTFGPYNSAADMMKAIQTRYEMYGDSIEDLLK